MIDVLDNRYGIDTRTLTIDGISILRPDNWWYIDTRTPTIDGISILGPRQLMVYRYSDHDNWWYIDTQTPTIDGISILRPWQSIVYRYSDHDNRLYIDAMVLIIDCYRYPSTIIDVSLISYLNNRLSTWTIDCSIDNIRCIAVGRPICNVIYILDGPWIQSLDNSHFEFRLRITSRPRQHPYTH
jgi:hypothetical protein